MIFSGVTILQGVEFPIFPIDFAWALQQCSATALPVITTRGTVKMLLLHCTVAVYDQQHSLRHKMTFTRNSADRGAPEAVAGAVRRSSDVPTGSCLRQTHCNCVPRDQTVCDRGWWWVTSEVWRQHAPTRSVSNRLSRGYPAFTSPSHQCHIPARA